MEFEDEHDEEQEEEEDDDEEEITIPPPSAPPSYDPVNSAPTPIPTRPRVDPHRRSGVVRYRECLKNHAVNIGGHALDGCGEFLPAGEDGTLDALKCAACSCHRNFHRKEIDAAADPPPPQPPPSYPQFSPYYRTPAPPSGFFHPPPQRPLALVPSSSGEMDDMSHPSSSGGGGGGGGSKKRFRTRFTQEQKDKMLAFAEKLGWRIQKHDEAAVQQFCDEAQVRRQVLKVWMHNNKHTLGKKP